MRPSLALFTPLEAFAFSALLALACADSELPAEGVGVDEAPRIEKVAGAMSGCESHAECDDGDAGTADRCVDSACSHGAIEGYCELPAVAPVVIHDI